MPKLIGLTGATGFVGREVLKNLIGNGNDYQVKALVRPGSEDKCIQSDKVNWIEGEMGNPVSETRLCAKVDTIINMAGLVTARSKQEYMKVNAKDVGTLAIAAQRANVKRFIHLSSLVAKKPGLSEYAFSKRAGEGILARKLTRKRAGIKGVVVRAPAVFGAGDKVTAPFYKMIRKGRLPAPGGRYWRERKISLIHVNDLADFITGDCLDGTCDGRTVSKATRSNITWPEFANECSLAMGKPVKSFAIPLAVLYPVAAVTSLTKIVFGKGHLTLEKLQEFLYEDWSIAPEDETETDLQFALKSTI
ncbi:MAG: NAD-dependent epimerase/dehydratase family protein [Robiginitomaculum sp.]